jgi:malonyl CoA-acyl carrier protein transacylase
MLALLCGGQGRLSPQAFDLVAEHPAAASIFKQAASLLGDDPRDLVRTRDMEALSCNHASQVLTVTATLTVYAGIVDVLPEEMATTGYSVGEMAAWSIAGAWTPEEALRLTDIRARAMDDAGGTGGHLGYIRGLDRKTVEVLAERHGCAIAISCPGDLFIVGGATRAVAASCRDAVSAGAAHADLLAVKVASHTARLHDAIAPLRRALDASNPGALRRGHILLAGGDGSRIFAPDKATAGLAAQVATAIDWSSTLDAIVEIGATRVLDLGPGHALADMMRAKFPDIATYAVDDFHTLDGLRRWIAAGD